jgi:hypothetical protein
VTINLERVGGFAGPIGKEVTELDLNSLSRDQAREIQSQVEAVPSGTWGGSFLSPHPKSWNFREALRIQGDGPERHVEFHIDQAPPELAQLVKSVRAKGKRIS